MEYVNLGRKLGIGTRIAAKILRDRAQNSAAANRSSRADANTQTATPAKRQQTSKSIDPRTATRNVTRGVVRGSKQFGQGFWKPFSRAVRALWHEVTGVFFGIFAAFFAQNLWRTHHAWRSGQDHRHFVIYLIFFLVFGYFSLTAFLTSRRTPHS